MLTRRQFIKRGAAGAGGVMLGNALLRAGTATAVAPTANLTSYMMPFAVPPAVALGTDEIHAFTARETTRRLHPQLAGDTHVWLYDDGSSAYSGYLGPTIVVQSGHSATLTYSNGLPATYPFPRIPVDGNLTDGDDHTRIIGHLHGAFDSGLNDGNPAASSEGGVLVGDPLFSAFYPNNQRATLLWYHDHAVGATRLNVFAGLAGGYVIRDAFDTGGPRQATDFNPWMPFGYGTGAGKYEIPIVIQDRQFNVANGDFLYPTMPPGAGTTGECGDGVNVGGYPNSEWPNSTGPWIGEYFGDEMLVNGVCSPVLDVEPAIYRFRLLNGCNARFLNLTFQNVGPGVAPPPNFVQIGAEQGLFRTPVTLGSLPMVTAERADVIVDFRKFAGQQLLLRNANMPKPYATPAPRLQDIMKFRVSLPSTQATNAPFAAVPTGTIDGGEVAGTGLSGIPVAHSRQIVLQEWNAGLPGWHLTLSPYSIDKATLPALAPITTSAAAACFHTSRSDVLARNFVPEEPKSGTVEDWEFYNYTPDTHPMHMHLTRFQLVDRRPIGTPARGAGTVAPAPWEQGWKDTVAAHPGMVTRIRQKFDLPDGVTPASAGTPNPDAQYVYHCHIVEHEDNDMMRPFIVVA